MNGFPLLSSQTELPIIDKSREGACSYLRATINQGRELHYRSTSRWLLDHRQLATERALIGSPGRSPANALGSNLAARLVLGTAAIELLDQEQEKHPERQWYLVTLINDRWITYDREPELWLGGMQAAARRVLGLAKFDGWLAAVEVQTIMEGLPGLGRWLLPHVHAVAWSDNPRFRPECAERRMCASGRLYSAIGARTADVSSLPDSCASNIAAYVFKYAALGKYRRWDANTPSGFRLAECQLAPIAAVRQNEILSQVQLTDLVFAGGFGTRVRAELKSIVNRSLESSSVAELTTLNAATFWRRAKPKRFSRYRPPIIHHGSSQRSLRD